MPSPGHYLNLTIAALGCALFLVGAIMNAAKR
jgi:hypothetical protein